MLKGFKTTMCAALAFAVIAGIAGCSLPSNSNTSGNATTQATTAATYPQSYKSVKEDNNGTLPEKGQVGTMKYEILGKDTYGNLMEKTKERGYYVDQLEQLDTPYFIVIYSGKKNTGGYDVKIVDLGLNDGELIITVEETSPAPDSAVTQAIDYPYCVLKLDKMPKDFKIVNTNGDEFLFRNGAED